MSGVGVSTVVTGLLQLSVPSYAFRLVRRFGTRQVGWFIVTAFGSMAMLHLYGPWKTLGRNPGSILMTDLAYAAGSVLLLMGLCQVEVLFKEREKAHSQEESLRDEWDSRLKQETAHLLKTNEALQLQIAQSDQASEELRQAEARYRRLFEQNPQPMWILDLRTSRFLLVNQAARRQYGFTAEEFAALDARDLLLPESAAEFAQDLARACTDEESRGIWQHCRKDGTLLDVDVTAIDLNYGNRLARLVVAQDITARRKCEMHQRQEHKMETVGQVAGGVAHHLNNILTIIEAHASVMQERPLDLKSAEGLEHICAASKRAAELTRLLLMAGSRHLLQLEQVDLNALIRELTPTLSRIAGDQVRLEHNFSYLPTLFTDRNVIEQALVNLALNAREAMPNGGTLTLGTAKVHIDESEIETGHPDRSGDYVCLSVQDTGCGIAPETQSRLFEPFFTTREHGQSAGLGLASVFGAARQLSGWVDYSTEINVGTVFSILLPCPPAAPAPSEPIPEQAAAPATGVILLVETDDRTRALARFVLNRQGYQVIEADGSATAQVLWKGQGASVDLVLVDPILPGDLSGCGLIAELRQLKPGLKVLYTPGEQPQGSGVSSAQLEAIDGVTSLAKPYSPDTLLQAVAATLKG